eukprot:2978595-Prymnesium_polylepis.1
MVSCSRRTLPVVQWNPTGGRDAELSRWDEVLERRLTLRQGLAAIFHCRSPVAVFRGEAHAEYG